MSKGLYDVLAKDNNGNELDNKTKDQLLEAIDTQKDENGFYLDAFGQKISFSGINGLRGADVKIPMSEMQQIEIKSAYEDYFYFRRNYCRILTKEGITRPEPREYQLNLEEQLVTGEDIVVFFPRQCVAGNTKLKVNNEEITIKELYDSATNEFKIENHDTFISSRTLNCKNISTNKDLSTSESSNINYVYVTHKYEVLNITLENGMTLSGSPKHVVINSSNEEVHLENSLNQELITTEGYSKVISVEHTGVFENMYDISLDSLDELFYSDGILSHNSGKTVTIACYLLWIALIKEDINIGVAANKVSLAQEVLTKIRDIYMNLPIWMQPGVKSWNKQSIELTNNNRILISASNSDAFRGYSLRYAYIDEASFIKANLFHDMLDSVTPAMASFKDSQIIFSSTANGLNHFYQIVKGAREGVNGYRIAEASWKDVPRWNKDGSKKSPEQFQQEQVAKNGEIHFAQNFKNAFVGSSATLIGAEALKCLNALPEEEIIQDKIFKGLRIFEEPESGKHYILTFDPKIDGQDDAGVHVFDVTSIPFKEVAAANISESYMVMPGRLFDLGNYYNKALIVGENNIGIGVLDTLNYNYEYEGEIFREKKKKKASANLLGFRTTTKTKRQILSLLKKFIEEDMLILKDHVTIEQLFNFIEKKNGSYSAEDGYKDDMVMATALLFAPMLDIKNFDDFKGFIDLLEQRAQEQKQEELEMCKIMNMGFSSDIEHASEEPFDSAGWRRDMEDVY